MTTVQGNKLIAIFMGYVEVPEGTLNGVKGVLEKEGNLPLYSNHEHHLYSPQYDKSWDWLMPSWGKLSSLLLDKGAFELIEDFKNAVVKNDIIVAWDILVKGIKLINE